MKLIPIATRSILIVGLISACAQSEFAGDTGQGVRNGVKPPSDIPNNSDTPGTNTPGNDDGLKTDDGGKIELVEAELQVDRLPDSARFQNCLFAHIVGQPVVELGCNRTGPGVDNPRPPLANGVKMKLLTNSCNQLRVYFKTNSGGGLKDNVTTALPGRISSGASKDNTGATGPGINIIKEASGGYLIEANDNNDKRWHDVYLRVKPPANRPNIKFTIENSGIPCG